MMGWMRRHLAAKIFISYLLVVLVGILALTTAAELAVPRAFDQHMHMMNSMMMGMMGMELETDLFSSFRAAFNEALTLAGLAALGVAVVTSVLVSRQVVAPIKAMMEASGRIAEGNYEQRVILPGKPDPDELDELGQLAVSFNRMADRLQRTEELRRRLIGDVAHELRTPLTAIKGSMEGLIDGVLPPQPETFQKIYREADRMQRLVEDLQELSRVEAGAFELDLKTHPAAKLVAEVVERLRGQFEEKDVALEVGPMDSGLRVRADRERVGQVLLNLVGNALQYTPPGGEVSIRAYREGDWVRFEVHDTGIGIPLEHLPHIFDRFYRVDKSRSRAAGGSGIGLTIAKHMVEAHGGRIWAQSEGPGKGSTFSFTLPAA
jgi:histidine kinase